MLPPHHRGLVYQSKEAVGTGVQRIMLDSYNNNGQPSGQRGANGYWITEAYDPAGREEQRGQVRFSIDVSVNSIGLPRRRNANSRANAAAVCLYQHCSP